MSVNAEGLQLQKLVHDAGPWVEPRLRDCWVVRVLPNARVKRLRDQLPDLLAMLEAADVQELDAHQWWVDQFGGVEARSLGIDNAHRFASEGLAGRIFVEIQYPTETMGGFAPETGDALAEWIGAWAL